MTSDGWLDLGITSPNYPRFRIAKNKMGEQASRKNSFVEITLVGGQESPSPSLEWSPRDPFGASVLVTCGEEKRMFQLNCGEGVSTQNAQSEFTCWHGDAKEDRSSRRVLAQRETDAAQ
jgi:hypothetical protein